MGPDLDILRTGCQGSLQLSRCRHDSNFCVCVCLGSWAIDARVRKLSGSARRQQIMPAGIEP